MQEQTDKCNAIVIFLWVRGWSFKSFSLIKSCVKNWVSTGKLIILGTNSTCVGLLLGVVHLPTISPSSPSRKEIFNSNSLVRIHVGQANSKFDILHYLYQNWEHLININTFHCQRINLILDFFNPIPWLPPSEAQLFLKLTIWCSLVVLFLRGSTISSGAYCSPCLRPPSSFISSSSHVALTSSYSSSLLMPSLDQLSGKTTTALPLFDHPSWRQLPLAQDPVRGPLSMCMVLFA